MITRICIYFLQNRALSYTLLILFIPGGIWAYLKMGKLEDAPFTIKQAVVTTAYPGASAEEVQSQVTDVLEEAIQSLDELYYLKSDNRYGLSKITVYVKKEIRAKDMQQLWDKLRRKVNDAQSRLPEGAGKSVVNDDFGDVSGVFYAIESQKYSYRQLEEEAKRIKNELLNVKDVARVELYGTRERTIEIKPSTSLLTRTGLTIEDIRRTFNAQNRVVDAGGIEYGTLRLRIDTKGSFSTIDEIKNMTLVSPLGQSVRLGEIAEINESYTHPMRNQMKINNCPAIGIAISTVSDGNVVEMGKAVETRIDQLKKELPDGVNVHCIYDQGNESAIANKGFIINLIVSVLTVVAVLFCFIGLKNGLLIGSSLAFAIFGTLIYMYANGIALQRMSLAAIVIAMGMLVDNAIVVYDSTLINMQKGMRKRVAIVNAVRTTAWPLLAATVIAVLTFLPVYLSPHITGELLSSLFIVIAVSLLLSWILAITQNVFFIQEFVRRPRPNETKDVLFNGYLYDVIRRMTNFTINHKYSVIIVLCGLLVLSGLGFKMIPNVFMPQLNKKYLTTDMWLPERTKIEETAYIAEQISSYADSINGIKQISSFVGQTPPRFYLANSSYGPQPNYAQFLIEAESAELTYHLKDTLQSILNNRFPQAITRVNQFELNTIPQALIEARFCGNDPAVLDSLTTLALQIMRNNPHTLNPRNEWGNMAPVIRAEYHPLKAGRLNVNRTDMMNTVKAVNDGVNIGIFRENEHKVPVLLYTPADSIDFSRLTDLTIWNGKQPAPLKQVTDDIYMDWEWPLVRTYNRNLSMAAQCDVQPGHTMKEVHAEIRKDIESIKLPQGYSFFWDSQYKDQKEALAALTKYFPMAILFLAIILIVLFRNFKLPLIIFLILPLSIIGVVLGLILTGFDFGFFCMAGWLGLLGMIIKNVIVLLDEVNIQRSTGIPSREAVINATVFRTRPVLMAAATTILGMVPLLFDVVFGGMATTIIFGLSFATLLTLFVTPALYAIFYKI